MGPHLKNPDQPRYPFHPLGGARTAGRPCAPSRTPSKSALTAYGLDELRYILDPANVKGPDYHSETFRGLKQREFRQLGEYRTRRLVLEAWDRMEADGTFASLEL